MCIHDLRSRARYLEGGVEQAAKAQKVFSDIVSAVSNITNSQSDEYDVLRKIYPKASNDMICNIIEMMK